MLYAWLLVFWFLVSMNTQIYIIKAIMRSLYEPRLERSDSHCSSVTPALYTHMTSFISARSGALTTCLQDATAHARGMIPGPSDDGCNRMSLNNPVNASLFSSPSLMRQRP